MNLDKHLPLALLIASGCIIPESAPDAAAPASRALVAMEDVPVKAEVAAPVGRDPLHGPAEPKEKPAWMRTADLFASAELAALEANVPVRGMAHFYGAPKDATMHLRVSGLTPGEYGAYVGKDCKSAAAMRDSNPFDKQGAGSVTVRPDEMKVGVLSIDRSGAGELDAAIRYTLYAKADLPPLTERAIILMPASAEKVDQPQTKVACGMIESVRGS